MLGFTPVGAAAAARVSPDLVAVDAVNPNLCTLNPVS